MSILIKPAYDTDASTYFTTAGVTNTAGRQQISRFVTGIKDLGLWSDMVCWPLRSSQNAGTGTTAYSLGGLGTFNGTLANGPTWGADGIVLSSTSHEITLPDNASLYNLRTGFAVFNPSSAADNQRIIEIQDNATIQGWYCLFRYGGGATETGAKYLVTRNSTFTNNAPNTETASLNSFRSSAFTANNTSDNVFRDGSLVSGGAKTGLLTINPTGSRVLRQLFANTLSMVGSFGLISTSTLTNANISSLHSLYKTTLGQGLGLS